jgi:hypothetical protein
VFVDLCDNAKCIERETVRVKVRAKVRVRFIFTLLD